MLKRTLYLAWRSLGWATRAALMASLLLAFLFSALVVTLRYAVLPNADQYREPIVSAVSRALGVQVGIGAIEAGWEGARPRLVLLDVVLFDAGGQPALRLGRMENSLAWWSLFSGRLQFHTIEITAPDLAVRRDAEGVIHVAGVALREGSGEGSMAQWLLAQGRIVVRDARLEWRDEARGAPPLALERVQLRLENSGRRHRFALRAKAPAGLAGTLDIRGDLAGKAWDRPADWSGQVYAELDYADLGAWRAWLAYPLELARGVGAMRLWLGFAGAALTEATADLRLRDVKARLGPGLPELDMPGLQGRLAWKRLPGGFELATEKLSLATRPGPALQPTDFLFRTTAPAGQGGGGELRANLLDLGTLVALSGYLPLDAEVREQLLAFSPRGAARDLSVKWSGQWPGPRGYSAKGRFSELALKRHRGIPGFTGLSGSLDGTDKGGSFAIDARRASLDLPGVFREPLALDSLTAQASWTRSGREFELRLGNVAFANPHAAGALYGTYRGAAGSAGSIDLTGHLTRADARFVGRYVPLAVSEPARAWLDQAFLGGGGSDVRLRLKGDLEQFPFPDGRDGLFEVTAKVSGGRLQFAEGWPPVENIRGDLAFRGQRMEAAVTEATILGARLERVRAQIPDLTVDDPALVVQGEAEGPASEFLRFVEASPVDGHLDGFTRGMRATGAGRLSLQLRMPLDRPEDSRVAGSFRFLGNRVDPGPDAPLLEQVNGTLEFTENTVTMRNAAAQVLGGPASFNVGTQRDSSVRITASGRMSGEGLRRSWQHPAAGLVRGAGDWRSVITLRRGQAEWQVESSLQGLTLDLPAPLAKPAGEAWPLRLERRPAGPQRQLVQGSLGRVMSWSLLQGAQGVERGGVSFGGTAVLPDRKGVWVYGSMPALDLDQWRVLLAAKGQGAAEAFPLAGLDLRAGTLDVLGRRFTDLHVSAGRQGGLWQTRLAGPEATGELQWRSEGKGAITARFKQFILPPDAPSKPAEASTLLQNQELPALDLVVESFGTRDRQLGRLELAAQPQDRDWRIERLRISNPEATLQATGLAQREPRRTRLKLSLEVLDAGKLLGRLGYPGTLKWGNGKLEGNLGWDGPAHALDYASLGGDIKLEGYKGQFLRIEPGAGKLLGILSLQALPRRLLFDFRDVVDSGFEFDTIAATATVARGVLSTRDFVMAGPAARVTMTGDVNLAAETQNLRVRIAPSLSEGVSLAGSVLGGPVVGAAALFMSKALQDPVGQLASVEYNVAGTWADPVVSKPGSAPAARPE
jgi:uncharacterized protein (TIGR02099 family)